MKEHDVPSGPDWLTTLVQGIFVLTVECTLEGQFPLSLDCWLFFSTTSFIRAGESELPFLFERFIWTFQSSTV